MYANEKKDDDDYDFTPFQGMDKGAVLQEKYVFNETPLNPRRCCHLLTKLLYLITQGETLTRQEATDVFFAATKLFQSQDVVLRRMTYLVLKHLVDMADDVIIITASLTKDMNCKTDIYRANSIRVLCRILTDVALLGQGERYLKQGIVDKESYVASASLVAGYHLINANPANSDIVKRWYSEINDASKSKNSMVQYHALGLLYRIRQHDRLAVSKIVTTMAKSSVRSSYAHCLLIRLACAVLKDDDSQDAALGVYLDSCLRHKRDMVELEAARAICSFDRPGIAQYISQAISVLQLFLSSPKPAVRFAAIRTLNTVSQTHPSQVTSCNLDMENLISDHNLSIATLAITTLLKTGSESSVDRLMKQISNFISEISDDFKIVVVDAIKTLCIKFPKKQRTLMNFLSNSLRDEGGLEYKKAIVEAILVVIKAIPESKEQGLTHLCEFIEDCEFTHLCTRILHVLGEEGLTARNPAKYVRYIYNRVILENPNVRASAVNALAKYGRLNEALRQQVIVLLRRCMHDSDDEVRDRAVFHLSLLENDPNTASRVTSPLSVPLENLDESLKQYLVKPSASPFDISSVSKESKAPRPKAGAKSGGRGKGAVVPGSGSAVSAADSGTYAEMLSQVPELAGLGSLWRSTKPVELTESETEYQVNVVKHVFTNHIVFQFNMVNTLEDQLLENVIVRMEPDAEEFEVKKEIPCPKLEFNNSGVCYSVVQMAEGFPSATFACTMRFIIKEVDPSTGEPTDDGDEDDYQIEDIDITTSDFMRLRVVVNFQEEWEKMQAAGSELVEVYTLSSMKTLQAAVNAIIEFVGMQPAERSNEVPAKRTKHILYLAGTFMGNVAVLVRCRMKLADGGGVNMELTVRSEDDDVNDAIVNAI